jgi:chromosome segregation ATPase
MTNIAEVVPGPGSESKEADAATDALIRFTQSANEFFSYQRIYAQGARANKALSLKEAEVREKDAKIKELESAIAVWTHRGHEEVTQMELERDNIAKEKSDLDTQLRQALTGKGKVQTQAEKTVRLLDKKTKESAQLQKEVLTLKAREEELKTTLSKEITAEENFAKQLHTTRTELGEYASYTANLVDLDLNNLYGPRFRNV